MLVLDGVLGDAEWSVGATASASQAAGPLLAGDGSLIGPELFQAPARSAARARTDRRAGRQSPDLGRHRAPPGRIADHVGRRAQVAAFLTGR